MVYRRASGTHTSAAHKRPLTWCLLERMTRFELATLTLARLWSPSVQSVYCCAVLHSPQNRPGNPSDPSSSYTALPSRSKSSEKVDTPRKSDSIAAMTWGAVELEPEVVSWLDSLTDNQFGQAERYIDLLADQAAHLSEPFTRQLDGNSASRGSTSTANQPESATTSPPDESSSC